MRICLVLDSSAGDSPVGGVEKATHSLCVGLRDAGHQVALIAGGEGGPAAWQSFPVVRVPASGRFMLLGGARRWTNTVGRILSSLKPDVVQGQGLGFAGAAAAHWDGGPTVVCAHGNTLMDLRHARGPAGAFLRAPLVRAQAVGALRHCDAFVNVTADWRVNCPARPRAQVHIPNPVDDAFFAATTAAEPGSVAFFGGPRRIKGSDLLLAAWTHVVTEAPDARLHLYGIERETVDGLPPNCLPRPALTSSEAIARTMSRASVVVMPSRYEVSPIVAAEAMTVGVPLVATDVGGVPAMTSGVAALCPPDPQEIARQIVSAIRNPQDWSGRIEEGRRRSAAFRSTAVVERYIALYEALLRRGHGPHEGETGECCSPT